MLTDTYVEQLVPIRRTTKDIIIYSLICIIAGLFCAVLFFFALQIPLLVFVGAVVIYGVYRLLGNFGTEYEYIYTNGDLDFDKISGKQNRKRLLTVDCKKIERIGKYTDGMTIPGNFSATYTCCEQQSDNKYYLVYHHSSLGLVKVIFTPNENLCEALEKSIPRSVSNGVF